MSTHKKPRTWRLVSYISVVAGIAASSFLLGAPARAAACTAPTTDYGSATSSLSVPADGTYRIWSRIMAPNTANNTYLLEVDGQNCYTVGGASVQPNVWTWVDYQDNNSKIQLSLTKGTHSVKFIGRQPGVRLDRVEITSDLQCVPVGVGNNCDVPLDTNPPSVTMTAPTADSTVSGNAVAVTATASDDVGVTKTEFYVNNTLAQTDTSSPYSFTWDTTQVQNGSQRLTVKAYDAAGNQSSDTLLVTVQNGDTQAPSVPTSLTATAAAYNDVRLAWKASTDNVGVIGYIISRNGTVITQVGAVTSYADVTTSPATQYSYQVTAIDNAGNKSGASNTASVTTQALPVADTSAPSTPGQPQATAVSSQQINLSWAPSTDNVGVTAYDVYRSGGGQSDTKVATVTTLSYGDTGLQPNTQYTYYVKARDAAGNTSAKSADATAKTLNRKRTSRLTGRVATTGGRAISGATVTIAVEGVRYDATTNSQGYYLLRDVPQGRYTVTFKAQGYKSRTSSVLLRNSTAKLNIQLRKR